MAVFIVLNIEHFAFGSGAGSSIGAFKVPAPDQRAFAWHDYGNRVGVWNLIKLFEDLKLPVAALVNSEVYDYCAEVTDAFRKRGDEIVGHGRTNSEFQGDMTEDQERSLVRDVAATIAKHEGAPPQGWLGPYLSETWITPDLLKEAGYKYLLDWHCDDQPIWFRTRSGPILSIPYATELNDWPIIAPGALPADEFADMIIDTFDEQLDASARYPLVMGITLHTFVAGQPFRLRQLRRAFKHIVQNAGQVWLTHPREIAQHVFQLPPNTVPGS